MPPPPDKPPFIFFGDGTFGEFHKELIGDYKDEDGITKVDWLIKPLQSAMVKYPVIKQMRDHNLVIKVTYPKDAIIRTSEDVGRRSFFIKTNPFGEPSNATRHDERVTSQVRFLEREMIALKREIKQLRKQVNLLTDTRQKVTQTMVDEFKISKGVLGPTYESKDDDKSSPPPGGLF